MSIEQQLLRAIADAHTTFVRARDARGAFGGLLQELLRITKSEYGFIGEVLREEGRPFLQTHAITDISWNEETKRFYERGQESGLRFTNLENLFGHVIRHVQTVVSNDPGNDPRSGGLPKGHPPLNAFLGIPFVADGEMLGMVGVANRDGGYEEELVELLKPLTTACSSLILGQRAEVARDRAEAALRDSEALARAIIEGALDAIIVIDEAGTVKATNPAIEQLFGWTPEELDGQNVSVLMPEPDRSAHDGYIGAYVRTGRPRVIGTGRQVTGRRKDGTTFPVELAVNVVEVDGRRHFTGTLRDVTARKAAEEKLSRLNAELGARVREQDAAHRENVLINELNGFLLAARDMSEIGSTLRRFMPQLAVGSQGSFGAVGVLGEVDPVASWGGMEATPPFPKRACWAIRRGEFHHGRRDDLECEHLEDHDLPAASCVPVMGAEGIIGVLTMACVDPEDPLERGTVHRVLVAVSNRLGIAISNMRLRARLEEESTRDHLTRLHNRRFLDEHLDRELRRSRRTQQPVAVIIADVDHFKDVNDRFGHDQGDAVLRYLADVIRGGVRGEDLVCRYGGEELVVVLPGSSVDDAMVRAELLRRRVERLEVPSKAGDPVQITVSMGVAGWPANGEAADVILAAADSALYQAKRAGRNRVERAPAREVVQKAG